MASLESSAASSSLLRLICSCLVFFRCMEASQQLTQELFPTRGYVGLLKGTHHHPLKNCCAPITLLLEFLCVKAPQFHQRKLRTPCYQEQDLL